MDTLTIVILIVAIPIAATLLVIAYRLTRLVTLQKERLKVEQAFLDGDGADSWKDMFRRDLAKMTDDKLDALREEIRKQNEALAESGKDTAKTAGQVPGTGRVLPPDR